MKIKEVDISPTKVPTDFEMKLDFEEMKELKAQVDNRTAELKGVSRRFANTLSPDERLLLNRSIRQNGFASQSIQRALPAARKRGTRKNAAKSVVPVQSPLGSDEIGASVFAIAICAELMNLHPEIYGELKARVAENAAWRDESIPGHYESHEGELDELIDGLLWAKGRNKD